MSSTDDPKADKIRRFEKSMRELIDEGHSFVDHEAGLEAAAARAGVDLQEVLPTYH
jgi:TPP-dependent pyruvate/acetoin dehydrogenase alpha subunit